MACGWCHLHHGADAAGYWGEGFLASRMIKALVLFEDQSCVIQLIESRLNLNGEILQVSLCAVFSVQFTVSGVLPSSLEGALAFWKFANGLGLVGLGCKSD